MPRKLEGSVVVLTGASRSIGRAAARLFAQRGASVVLAVRQEEALLRVAAECEDLGGRVLAVPTDVADSGAVEELARKAVGRFGRIDVWVNNAVLLAFGRLEDVPPEANRRLVEGNLLGYMHGPQAALSRFREMDAGVLINVSSGSWGRHTRVPTPRRSSPSAVWATPCAASFAGLACESAPSYRAGWTRPPTVSRSISRDGGYGP